MALTNWVENYIWVFWIKKSLVDAERHLKTTSLLHIRECARMKADFWTPALFVTIAVHYRYQANYLLHNILFSTFFSSFRSPFSVFSHVFDYHQSELSEFILRTNLLNWTNKFISDRRMGSYEHTLNSWCGYHILTRKRLILARTH